MLSMGTPRHTYTDSTAGGDPAGQEPQRAKEPEMTWVKRLRRSGPIQAVGNGSVVKPSAMVPPSGFFYSG